MNEDFDIVGRFAMQCIEQEDQFIFEQIKPYCEKITQMTIEKRELETSLMKSKPQMVIVAPDDDNFPDHFECPRCSIRMNLFSHPNYCSNCGQALEWKEVGEF